MTPIIPLLLDALAVGAIRLDLGRIDGCAGYYDPRRRVITLDLDASTDELTEGVATALAALASAPPDAPPEHPTVRPVLALVHSADEVERPPPGEDDEPGPVSLEVVS